MALSLARRLAASETCGEALRLLGAARNVPARVPLGTRAGSTVSADSIALRERGKRPMLSQPCTAVVHTLGLTDGDAAHLMLLARIDRAPEA
jgi:hypothetical protein